MPFSQHVITLPEQTLPKRKLLLTTWEILSDVEREMFQMAVAVRKNAQAPYSKFYCGAALQSVGGGLYRGCNVERCTYTQTTHAEQNAIDGMVAGEGPVGIRSLAVCGGPRDIELKLTVDDSYGTDYGRLIEETVMPCPHCRACLWENCLGDPKVKIMCLCPDGHILVTNMGTLLPLPFGPANLGIDYARPDCH
jgi:cytidine deaminase